MDLAFASPDIFYLSICPTYRAFDGVFAVTLPRVYGLRDTFLPQLLPCNRWLLP